MRWLFIWDYFCFRSKRFEDIAEGQPRILVQDGVVNEKLCRNQLITRGELEEALRHFGIRNISDVKVGILETNGHITAFKD